MMIMAMKSDYKKAFSPNLPSLVAPESMLTSIRTALGEENLSLANMLKSVYISLAKSYDKAIKDIEKICRKQIENIIIVGGGSKDKYLNRLTSEITGKKVFTGLSRLRHSEISPYRLCMTKNQPYRGKASDKTIF